jgi:CBS domain containing-hemolysin-like protein
VNTLALVLGVLLLAGNAFFVGAEFSVISVRRSQVEPLAESSRRARVVLSGVANLSLMLAGCQLGITLCSLGLGAVAEPALAQLLEPLFDEIGLPESTHHPIAFAIALAVVVFLHMVLGEMVPKNIAIATPEKAALVLVPPLVAFVRVVRPVLHALNQIANGALHLFHVEPKDELNSSYSPDELAEIIAESRQEGLLEAEEHERLSGALSLRETTARSIMLGFDDLLTIGEQTTADELEQLAVTTGYSRFPVRSDADDPATPDVVEGGLLGFVHIKDVLGMTAAARRKPLPPRLRRPMPDLAADLPLQDVLATLQRTRSHLAQVVDERGAIGVVALEDVVQEFVGEVEDATNPLHAPALP